MPIVFCASVALPLTGKRAMWPVAGSSPWSTSSKCWGELGMEERITTVPSVVAEQVFQEASAHVEKALSDGQAPNRILQEFVNRGWPHEQAADLVASVQLKLREARVSGYKRRMRNGILWAIGGVIVTAWTYVFAPDGKYFVFWGAVIYGIFDFFSGLIGWLKYR
jgi:hypothetical protein